MYETMRYIHIANGDFIQAQRWEGKKLALMELEYHPDDLRLRLSEMMHEGNG
jgi:hypothetical protein